MVTTLVLFALLKKDNNEFFGTCFQKTIDLVPKAKEKKDFWQNYRTNWHHWFYSLFVFRCAYQKNQASIKASLKMSSICDFIYCTLDKSKNDWLSSLYKMPYSFTIFLNMNCSLWYFPLKSYFDDKNQEIDEKRESMICSSSHELSLFKRSNCTFSPLLQMLL